MKPRRIAVIGGGAAGFFAALAAKEHNPFAEVFLFERAAQVLSKVKISGGGRCNVTHACFEPRLLVQNYSRGHKELLGPFHTFQPRDTIAWFQKRGVVLKEEPDGRMFPLSNSSETIIRCFLEEAERLAIPIQRQAKLEKIKKEGEGFLLYIREKEPFYADKLIVATGSASLGWEWAQSLGHTIQPPVPSLFTFNIPSFPLVSLAGVSHDPVGVALMIEGKKFAQVGSLLITHWGLSGPAVLKLSARAARALAVVHYEATVVVDWAPECSQEGIMQWISQEKAEHPTKQLGNLRVFSLPKSLWRALCQRFYFSGEETLSSLNKAALLKIASLLKKDEYKMSGKTTNKEEFVTCGGVTLTEVSFKTMESLICPGLYFCGEVLDIDGVTGGFNFQNAWTTGWLAGRAAAAS